jgi:hypothetical protein
MWLKIEEVMQLGIARSTIYENLSSGKWESREAGRGRNGKPIREVLLESLPEQLQFKWAEMNRPETETEISTEETSAALEVKLTQALMRFEKETVREAFMAEANRLLEIVRRYDALNPKRVKNADTGKYEFTPEVEALSREAVCRCPLVTAIEPHRKDAVSPFTLDGWARKAKIVGPVAFLRAAPEVQRERDKREAKISPKAEEWIKANWRQYASPRIMYTDLQKKAKREKWQIPSEKWLYRRWKEIPKAVMCAVREGDKAYNSRYAPFVPRDFTELEALQVLCGDHSQRDVMVVMPDGSLGRPWLTVWYDLRTGLIWGWHIDESPSSKTASLAYANGCRQFGAQPPAQPDDDFYSHLYTDQGRDYRGQIWTGKTLTFTKKIYKQAFKIEGGLETLCTTRRVGFFDETGIKHLMARGYNAKEKPVERIFRDFSDWEENHFSPEYVGRDAKNKPDAWVKAWHTHHRISKKFKGDVGRVIEHSPFMSLSDYRENIAAFIQEFNEKEHKKTVLGGRTIVPLEEYDRLYTTRYEIPEETLALLLMKRAKKQIGKNGLNLFRANWWYVSPELAGRDGESVEYRYSDEDLERVWIILTARNKSETDKIVEAKRVSTSGLLNVNKDTLTLIKKYEAKKKQVVRDFQIFTHAAIRGETAEDAIAAQLQQEVEEFEMPKVAAMGERPTVHIFNPMSAPKVRAAQPMRVTAEEIASVEPNNNIFQFPSQKPVSINEWGFDEDE